MDTCHCRVRVGENTLKCRQARTTTTIASSASPAPPSLPSAYATYGAACGRRGYKDSSNIRRTGYPSRRQGQGRPVGHLRGSWPYVDERRGIELGGAFNNHNVEKLGVTLTCASPAPRIFWRSLSPSATSVTENFSKGVLDRWGFSYEEMTKIKPDIIYVSNCGFGHVGSILSVQDMGADCPGSLGTDVSVRPPGLASRRIRLFVHGPHGRLSHGDRDPDGRLSTVIGQESGSGSTCPAPTERRP